MAVLTFMSVAATSHPSLRIALGPPGEATINPGVPVLGGETIECLFPDLRPIASRAPLHLFTHGDWLVGSASVDLADGIEAATQKIYDDLLTATGDRHLARIWNYVPEINADGPEGLENYRAFCRGRSLAFERVHGSNFKAHLPAASAVGSSSDRLTVVFVATALSTHHVENPLQVPAYDYPSDYGPRSPSFARATLVDTAAGRTVFVSGTSAVRGHATVAPQSTGAQLECTLENLRELSQVCELGRDLGAGGRFRRYFKVYLRHDTDFVATTAALTGRLLQPGDEVSYVKSDICRAALNIEIEATLLPR